LEIDGHRKQRSCLSRRCHVLGERYQVCVVVNLNFSLSPHDVLASDVQAVNFEIRVVVNVELNRTLLERLSSRSFQGLDGCCRTDPEGEVTCHVCHYVCTYKCAI